MLKLYGVECGYKQSPNLTRILTSIIVMADSKDEALQFAQHRYPEALAQGAEHRIVEVNHVIINWPDGEVAVIEEKHSKQFHC